LTLNFVFTKGANRVVKSDETHPSAYKSRTVKRI